VYGLDDRGFVSGEGLGFIGPTQPPFQWLSGAIALREKRSGSEADHLPLSSADVKNAWGYNFTLLNTNSWSGAGKKEGSRETFLHLRLVNVMITRDLVTCVTLISFVP